MYAKFANTDVTGAAVRSRLSMVVNITHDILRNDDEHSSSSGSNSIVVGITT